MPNITEVETVYTPYEVQLHKEIAALQAEVKQLQAQVTALQQQIKYVK